MRLFQALTDRTSSFIAKSDRWLCSLCDQLISFIPPSMRGLSVPPLSSLVFYIQAALFMGVRSWTTVEALWSGKRLVGDRSIPGLLNEYTASIGTVKYEILIPETSVYCILTFDSTLWLKPAAENDPAKKRVSIVTQLIVAFVCWIYSRILGHPGLSNGTDEDQQEWQDGFTTVISFFAVGAISSWAALRFELQKQETKMRGNAAARRVTSLLESYGFDEDAIRLMWVRRPEISEHGREGLTKPDEEEDIHELFLRWYASDA